MHLARLLSALRAAEGQSSGGQFIDLDVNSLHYLTRRCKAACVCVSVCIYIHTMSGKYLENVL